MLPWRFVGNRAFLRCLLGLGLAHWRLGEAEQAAKTFRRMLEIDPSDEPDARSALAKIEAGRGWEEREM